ncbi:MAG TPA: hypothetical protein VM052_08905 [Candidatus Limnocylindrales bacterium]|nr:hypothetical protein [Candidatus Limnocylindrales bacterium]
MSPLEDLEASERELDRLLSSVPPLAPPVGLRDRVMSRLGERRVTWELLVALIFAVPSLVYLGRLVLVHGDDFARAIGNVVTAASSDTSDAFFFVDGLTVIALALLGVACAFAAHALLSSIPRSSGLAR